MNNLVTRHFWVERKSVYPNDVLMFTTFVDRSETNKEGTASPKQILAICQDTLEANNREATKSLDIVFFRETVDHLSSLCRVLVMRCGHAMLAGGESS
jgi:hypothetical protein